LGGHPHEASSACVRAGRCRNASGVTAW
jgi:hypothetical protein